MKKLLTIIFLLFTFSLTPSLFAKSHAQVFNTKPFNLPRFGIIHHPIKTFQVWQNNPWFQPFEHMAIGVGIEVAVGYASGNPANWRPGMTATVITAGFKEGTDLHDHKDSVKSATKDAMEIIGGAILAARVIK